MIRFPTNATIRIEHDWMRRGVAIMCWDETGYFKFGEGGSLTHVIAEPGVEIEPLWHVTGHGSTAFMQSLADALGEYGVMPKTVSAAKELEATKAHLEDMRAMAKAAFAKAYKP